MKFEQLELMAPILDALKKAGYTDATPIQEQAIPEILALRDVLACAQTGTGKTAAFSLPIIQLLAERKAGVKQKSRPAIKALIVTPTRELAIQIGEQLRMYGQFTKIRHTVIFGGVGKQPQVQQLRRGVDILVATPGRLLDLQQQGEVYLKNLEIFVLDEADRMLDMGFIHDVRKLLKLIPAQRQSLFLSATMPKNIVELSNTILTNPVQIEITPASSTAETVAQKVYFVDATSKRSLLLHILQEEVEGRVLVFTRTKYGADKLVRFLKKNGVKSEAIHGNKSQTARQKALSKFKKNQIQTLVATDIAARGIDIQHLEFVINFEVPNVAETYVHRIGRSGRAGATGMAISLCAESERPFVAGIQKLIGFELPVEQEHPFPTEDPKNSELISIKKPIPKTAKKKKQGGGNKQHKSYRGKYKGNRNKQR